MILNIFLNPKYYEAIFRIKFDTGFISVSSCPSSNEIQKCQLNPIGSINEFKTFIEEELRKNPLESRWSELERRVDNLLFISA